MALKQTDKDKLKALGFDVTKLETAIKDEAEVDFAVPPGEMYSPETLAARDANKLQEGKTLGVKEGEVQGKDLAAKAIKKKFAIEDATKEIDKVLDLVVAKNTGGDQALKEQVATLLKEKESNEARITEAEKRAESATTSATLIGFFPANRSTDLKDTERLSILTGEISFEMQDGKRIAKRNGEIIKDPKDASPLPPERVVADYFAERKWTPAAEGGRGGGDNPGTGGAGGATKLSELKAAWEKKNPGGNTVSPEFQTEVEAAAKANPNFDFYN